MSNPFSGILTTAFKTTFVNAIDALLENDALTLPCQYIFADTDMEECPNCIFDAISGRSSGQYKAGGPISFTHGNCPYCYGVGLINTDSTLNTHLVILFDYKQWIGWNGVSDNTMVPFGQVQTLSKLSSSLVNIRRAKELLIDTNILQYVRHRFTRISEPNPLGLGGDDYIVTMWKRLS